jgi:DNA replication protein DnaC
MQTNLASTHASSALSGDNLERFNDEGVRGDDKTLAANSCVTCSGTGWELVSGKGVRPCICLKKDRLEKLLASAQIPKLYCDATLQSYTPVVGNLSQLRAFNSAHTFVRDYPVVERGLLFMGSVGVGKTHLAVAILRGLIEKGISCRFYEYRSLLKEIQSSYNPNTSTTEIEVLASLIECEVIVLDELGAAKPSEWVQDTIGLIINARYNEKRLTILTTNYLDGRRYDGDEILEDRIGARLRSRLYQMCKTVEINGDDYRRRFDS